MPVPTNATHLDLSYELNRTMMTMNLDDDDDDWCERQRTTWRIDDKQSSRAPSVEDDEEGHLIYRSGDVLQDRCVWIPLDLNGIS